MGWKVQLHAGSAYSLHERPVPTSAVDSTRPFAALHFAELGDCNAADPFSRDREMDTRCPPHSRHLKNWSSQELGWMVGLHLTFVITGVLFAVSERIGHKAEV